MLVNVVATDGNGQAIHGLKAQDLTVLEDGKPQRISIFEEHRADAIPVTKPAALNLPDHVYTNYVTPVDAGALTVLLFDSLNTDRAHLTYAKREMLSFLTKLPAGKRVALFTLGHGLRMVQDFTEDSDSLIDVARHLSTTPHPSYSNAKEMSTTIAELKDSGLTRAPAAYRAMVEFLGEDFQGKQESRVLDTLDGLNQLARTLAVVPGRKNLIWISGGFPFDFVSNVPQIRKTAALLAEMQIAVYPVDARGVLTLGADGSTRSSEIFAPVQTQSYETISGQGDENISLLASMINIARLTGGRAYYNKNDLQGAIADGMESGSNYYTLAYRPGNPKWNGTFRKIEIKGAGPRTNLLYRSGYYAILDPVSSSDSVDRMIGLAMQPNVPLSTALIMKARVIAPSGPDQAAAIDMLIDVHGLSFTETGQKHKTPKVQFAAIAWDAKGHPAGSFSADYRQELTPEQLESLQRTGLQMHQELLLKPGVYQLRLGVIDRLTGRIGTLDVPLTVESHVAAN